MTTELRPEATAQQVIAAITASQYRSARALAVAIDVDHVTLNRHLNGKSPLKMERIFDILELLDLPVADFFVRVQLRYEGLQLAALQRTA